MKLNVEELTCTVRLLQNDDFKMLMAAMGNHAEELNKKLVMQNLDTGDLHNLQGQTRAMVTIMDTIIDAPTELDKYAQPTT